MPRSSGRIIAPPSRRAASSSKKHLNGLEGLEKLLLQPFDLAIVDVNMPQMDGITFLHTLRSKELPVSGIPVLVTSTEAGVTGYGSSAKRRRQLLSRETDQAGNAGGVCSDLLRSAAMNEFVEQFLLESRELVAQATDDLMALEEKPGDRERLDGAFRAFHTLKGAAGIVEFAAMARTLHAAEDILATLRSSGRAYRPTVLDECLTCLDLTSRWLDDMQASGEAPSTADVEADDMIARLVGSLDGDEDQNRRRSPASNDWLDRLRVAAGDHFSEARTALRYVPDPDAFFQGDDPLIVVASLPQLW